MGIAGARETHCLLGRACPARLRNPVRAYEGLEASPVAAAAQRSVRLDRLMPDLPGRAVVPLEDLAVDGDHPADARPKRESDHRVGAASGPEPELGEPEGPRVVDQRDRAAEGCL